MFMKRQKQKIFSKCQQPPQFYVLPLLTLLCTFMVMALLTTYVLANPGTAALMPGPCHGEDCVERTLQPANPPLTGNDVRELQARLAALGYHPGPADGVYGEETAAAVRQFQINAGLNGNSRVDHQTWEALGKGVQKATTNPGLIAPVSGAPQGTIKIVVDTSKHLLTLYADGRIFKQYPVCVGKPSTPSPVGEWKIVSKGNLGGPFGTRWMGLNVPWGTFGIHGTNRPWSIGNAESAGCTRMFNENVEEIYPWVPAGTRVKIIGEPRRSPGWPNRELGLGAVGPDVVEAQILLRREGLYWGVADGQYGPITELAIKYFQQLRDLPMSGKVDIPTYDALGIFKEENVY